MFEKLLATRAAATIEDTSPSEEDVINTGDAAPADVSVPDASTEDAPMGADLPRWNTTMTNTSWDAPAATPKERRDLGSPSSCRPASSHGHASARGDTPAAADGPASTNSSTVDRNAPGRFDGLLLVHPAV